MCPSSSIPDKKLDLVEAWLHKIGPNFKQEKDTRVLEDTCEEELKDLTTLDEFH